LICDHIKGGAARPRRVVLGKLQLNRGRRDTNHPRRQIAPPNKPEPVVSNFVKLFDGLKIS